MVSTTIVIIIENSKVKNFKQCYYVKDVKAIEIKHKTNFMIIMIIKAIIIILTITKVDTIVTYKLVIVIIQL